MKKKHMVGWIIYECWLIAAMAATPFILPKVPPKLVTSPSKPKPPSEPPSLGAMNVVVETLGSDALEATWKNMEKPRIPWEWYICLHKLENFYGTL